MRELLPEQFTFTRWRRCDLLAMFGCGHRYGDIARLRHRLRPHVVGACDGSRVPCRPKAGLVAVMFFWEGHHGWTHLRPEEVEVLDAA